jgi:hypothetical protein
VRPAPGSRQVGFEPSAALPQRPRCWVCSAGELRPFLPLVTAGAHRDPGVTDAVRTQHGPEAGCLRRRDGRLPGQWAPLVLSCSERGGYINENHFPVPREANLLSSAEVRHQHVRGGVIPPPNTLHITAKEDRNRRLVLVCATRPIR